MLRSIRWKLLASYLLLAVLILATFGGIFLKDYLDEYVDTQRQLMRSDAQMLAATANRNVTQSLENVRFFDRVVYCAGRYDGVIWLIDADGQTIAYDSATQQTVNITLDTQTRDAVLQDAGSGSGAQFDALFRDFFPEKMIGAYAHVYRSTDKQEHGTVVIFMRMRAVYAQMWSVAASVAVAGMAALFGGVLLMAYYTRSIINPLKQIASAAQRVQRGDFSVRVQVKSDDEIGQMADSFNAMLVQLDDVEQRRRKFVADVSHELRTPLTSLQGYLQGFADGVIAPQQWPHYAQIALSEAKRMSVLVRDLLELTRYSNGSIVLERCRFDVCALCVRVLTEMQDKIQDKGLTAGTSFSRSPCYAFADPMRIEQVLVNLADNAVKFTPKGGSVILSVRPQGNRVYIQVTDTGIGMDEQTCQRVFDRFYQHNEARTPGSGYGLGLSIVREIVQLHGAKLELSSCEGKGTTFTLILPSEQGK